MKPARYNIPTQRKSRVRKKVLENSLLSAFPINKELTVSFKTIRDAVLSNSNSSINLANATYFEWEGCKF